MTHWGHDTVGWQEQSDDSYRIKRIISHLLGLHKIDDTCMVAVSGSKSVILGLSTLDSI